MKKIIFTLLIIRFSLLIVNAQTGWYPLTSGTNENIYDIQFLDANTGYFVSGITFSSGTIKKTTDGGASWLTQATAGAYLLGIYFVNSNTGFAVGYPPFKKTTNGGQTWFNLNVNEGGNKVYFLDANTGFVAGFGVMLYTTNGGSSWAQSLCGNDNIHQDIHYINASTGCTTGFSPSMCRTTNAGQTWNPVSINPYSSLMEISFIDSLNGLCCGTYRAIYKTNDAGINWNIVYSNPAYYKTAYDVKYIDINNAVAVGDTGFVIKTTNGGVNWINQTSGTSQNLNAVFFLNLNTGWACGNNGVLIKTTNGGLTLLEPISTQIPKTFSLSQNYPNPFNPSTKIKFDLPKSNFTLNEVKGLMVKMSVYDILGKEITTLVNESLKPGSYEVEFDGSNYPSGVYYYKLTSGDFTETKKMVLIK